MKEPKPVKAPGEKITSIFTYIRFYIGTSPHLVGNNLIELNLKEKPSWKVMTRKRAEDTNSEITNVKINTIIL